MKSAILKISNYNISETGHLINLCLILGAYYRQRANHIAYTRLLLLIVTSYLLWGCEPHTVNNRCWF